MDRETTINWIQQNPNIPVLIIGAGVNGIGTFRDLALQGVDVLIVDKGDFCSGASAASSHMVHGGIRYLENGEFRLVREAVQERNRLIQNAPHYVKPLATTIPIFKWTSGLLNAPLKFMGWLDKPSERGAFVIKMGLMMYDAYTRAQGTVPRHDFHLRRTALSRYPHLNPDIVCTATYYDAAMPTPERICIDLLHDAQAAHPQAHALNYVRAIQAVGDTVILQDEVTGQKISVKPQIVINAAGPWIDFTNIALGQNSRFIGGTKGSHLVLAHPQLRAMIGNNEFFFENDDGRIVLIYPLYDRVMIGTSDIPIDDPDHARCTDEEIDYFFNMINRVFPTVQLDRSHIVFQFSGVRPLPANDAENPGQISRDHTIRVIEANEQTHFPIYCLIGGKWTTFRAFAQKTADKVLAYLKHPRRRSTANIPIGGGHAYPRTPQARQTWLTSQRQQTQLSLDRLDTLLDRYGTRAAAIAQFISQAPDHPLTHKPDYSQREIIYLSQTEKVLHLDDLILRRSLLGMLGYATPALLNELANIISPILNWSDKQRQQEITHTATVLAQHHGLTQFMLTS